MQKRGSGRIFFTEASAGVKAFPNSSVFAIKRFVLRSLAQSLARELHPQNIHIRYFVIDEGILSYLSFPETVTLLIHQVLIF